MQGVLGPLVASPWGLLSARMRGTQLTRSPLHFKESALRRQSLHLRFDPLLEDSPERPAPAAPKTRR